MVQEFSSRSGGYAAAFRNDGLEIRARADGTPEEQYKEVMGFVRGLDIEWPSVTEKPNPKAP